MSGLVLDSESNGVFVNVFFSAGRIIHPLTQWIFYLLRLILLRFTASSMTAVRRTEL
jgi:hypothetical protein